MLWSMVSKAADRSRRQRHDNFCDPMAKYGNSDAKRSKKLVLGGAFGPKFWEKGRSSGVAMVVSYRLSFVTIALYLTVHSAAMSPILKSTGLVTLG